jgi:hypothetical protein
LGTSWGPAPGSSGNWVCFAKFEFAGGRRSWVRRNSLSAL